MGEGFNTPTLWNTPPDHAGMQVYGMRVFVRLWDSHCVGGMLRVGRVFGDSSKWSSRLMDTSILNCNKNECFTEFLDAIFKLGSGQKNAFKVMGGIGISIVYCRSRFAVVVSL
jgi:hypothetical protein